MGYDMVMMCIDIIVAIAIERVIIHGLCIDRVCLLFCYIMNIIHAQSPDCLPTLSL